MSRQCSHLSAIHKVKPSARGCEECLKIGSEWVHLRICRTCGHVGCCDDSIRCTKESDIVADKLAPRMTTRTCFANRDR